MKSFQHGFAFACLLLLVLRIVLGLTAQCWLLRIQDAQDFASSVSRSTLHDVPMCLQSFNLFGQFWNCACTSCFGKRLHATKVYCPPAPVYHQGNVQRLQFMRILRDTENNKNSGLHGALTPSCCPSRFYCFQYPILCVCFFAGSMSSPPLMWGPSIWEPSMQARFLKHHLTGPLTCTGLWLPSTYPGVNTCVLKNVFLELILNPSPKNRATKTSDIPNAQMLMEAWMARRQSCSHSEYDSKSASHMWIVGRMKQALSRPALDHTFYEKELCSLLGAECVCSKSCGTSKMQRLRLVLTVSHAAYHQRRGRLPDVPSSCSDGHALTKIQDACI